jgi:hypothetical protein
MPYKDSLKAKECKRKHYENNKEVYKDRTKKWRENNLEAHRASNRKWLENNKEYNNDYYENNKKHIKELHDKWEEENKELMKEYKSKWEKDNKEQVSRSNKIRYEKYKNLVFDHYGHKCSCPECGEAHFEFLTIDHIDGGGRKHRKDLKIGNLYRWLVKNNFPLGFRTLCMNCNFSIGLYGYCPHQLEKE